jgi:UDP-glucose 4-epimerase
VVSAAPGAPPIGPLFLTGGTGYLGRHFLELQDRNTAIRALVRRVPDWSRESIEWVKGDLSHEGDWRNALEGCSAVVHLATANLESCEQHPAAARRLILDGLTDLIAAATKHGVRRFLVASTAEVYGAPKRVPITEKTALQPLSFYGYLKGAADLYTAYCDSAGMIKATTLRFSNLFGKAVEGQMPRIVLRTFAGRILAGDPVVLHASLKNSRDFLHVKDAALALWKAIHHEDARGVINIGSGVETTLEVAAKRLAELASRPLSIDFRRKEGRLRRGKLSIERARRLVGFQPNIPFDQGLREVLEDAVAEMRL